MQPCRCLPALREAPAQLTTVPSPHPFPLQTRQFVLLSKDAARVQPAATALLVSGKRLHLVMAGLDGTLRMLGYDPTHANSWKGQRLVHRCAGVTG